MKEKKELKIVGFCFLFLALLDVVDIVYYYLTDYFTVDNIIQIAGSDVTQMVAKITIAIVISVLVLSTLLKIYFAVKAIKQANGTGKGKSHIVLATIILIISVIAAIIMIASFIQKQADIFMVILSITNVIIYGSYIKAAKVVKEKTN